MMVTANLTSGGSPDKPADLTVDADRARHAVLVTVCDDGGDGVQIELMPDLALYVVLKLVGAVARLCGAP